MQTPSPWATKADVEAAREELMNLGQAIDVVTLFLTAHPEYRNFGGAGVVARALAQAFPCRR